MHKQTDVMIPTTWPSPYSQLLPKSIPVLQGLRFKLDFPNSLLSENCAVPMDEERWEMLTETEQQDGEDTW